MIDMDRLASELIEVAERHQKDSVALIYALAYRVIRFFLGAEWAERRVRLHATPDAWMLNGLDETTELRFVHIDRVVTLADALFRLSGCSGFEALLERFSRPDTKPSCIEADVASLFAEEQFEVEIIRERGIRGQDFDFRATKDAISVSVEVTAKSPVPISAKTLFNTLSEKRDQVPSDKPAILYVQIPKTWASGGAITEQALSAAISNNFARSRRFNAVVIIWEFLIPAFTGAVIGLAYRPFIHPNPRHQLPSVPSLTPSIETMDFCGLQQRLIVDPVMTTTKLQSRTNMPSFVKFLHLIRPDLVQSIAS